MLNIFNKISARIKDELSCGKYMSDLSGMIENDQFEEFCKSYKSAPFDINTFRPGFFSIGRGNLLHSAFVAAKPEFINFLIAEIGLDYLVKSDFSIGYSSKGQQAMASLLYRALDIGMHDLARDILQSPFVDVDKGAYVLKGGYSKFGTWNGDWEETDTVLNLAKKINDTKIIEAVIRKHDEKKHPTLAEFRDQSNSMTLEVSPVPAPTASLSTEKLRI